MLVVYYRFDIYLLFGVGVIDFINGIWVWESEFDFDLLWFVDYVIDDFVVLFGVVYVEIVLVVVIDIFVVE